MSPGARPGTPWLLGAALAGGRGRRTGLVLLTVNGAYASGWEALTIFALMFTGTMLYRVDRGNLSPGRSSSR